MNEKTDDTRMTCLKMAMEVARQTPGTDVVALAERFFGFLEGATNKLPEERKPQQPNHYHEIIREVAANHQLSLADILGKSRIHDVCAARHEAIREVYSRHPSLSTPDLGDIFNRDQASILYALKKAMSPAPPPPPALPYPEPKPIMVGSVAIMPAAYTVASFCDAYGIRRNLAYDEMKAGRLLYRKAGRKTLIRKVDADAWLAQLAATRPAGDKTNGLVNMNLSGQAS